MSLSLQSLKIDEIVSKATKYAEENPIVVGASAVAALVAGALVIRKAELKRDGKDFESSLTGGFRILNNTDHTLKTNEFSSSISNYEGVFAGARKQTGAITSEESVEVRKKRYADMVNDFYNLVTDFYEWGWGQSFHFGPRFHNETFVESIKRTEYHLCSRLGMKPGVRALDVGCGVGGPMRNMAIFSGATIDGITINEYQVKIGNKYNQMHGLAHICKLTQGDFQKLPWEDSTFDVAYAIEATCHSPDRVQTFSGVARVLKPGGLFAGYEWVMTDKYDPTNKDHVRIKEGIEVGNGLPTLVGGKVIIDNLEKAGFEVLDYYDANRGVHQPNEIPWYDTLNGKMSLTGFRMTRIGRICTHTMVTILETLRIAPAGSTRVSALLNATAIDLVDGGKLEIFTPSFFFIAKKKPVAAKK
jgi:sterol 24-C-methyltransferase